MSKTTSVLAVMTAAVAACLFVNDAYAQAGSWMVRGRILNMDVDNGNSPSVPTAQVSVNNKTFPEIDFVYNLTDNISAELVLTYPQKHDVRLNGANIGSLKHLPPTLMAQYQFMPNQKFNPYVGLGLNYTRFMSVKLPTGITADKDSLGLAFQIGADFEVAKNTYINLDFKRVNIRSDIKVNGNKLTELQVDPNLVSIGIGYRF
jgi:outer membrane protein